MYAIKNDDMYLMDYRIGALPMPTCVWSIRPEDARLFESRGEAKAVADRVGGKAVKVCERRT